MKVPSDNRWTQTNEGDILGTLNDTKNVTFDDYGKLSLSKRPFALHTSDSSTGLGYTLGIVFFNNNYIAVTDDEAINFELNGATVSQVAGNPNFALNTDVQVCYNRMYTTIDDNLSYYTGSGWTNTIYSLTSGVPHPLTVFDSFPTYKLAVGNGNKVELIDSSGNDYDLSTSGYSLLIPEQYQITTMRYRSGYLYIGTKEINGGEAKIFLWDGQTVNANYEIPVGASWVFSMTEYGTSVAAITSQGELLVINGAQAQQIAALPIYYRPDIRWQGSTGLTLNGKVFNRGMVTVGRNIYMNIDGEPDTGELPAMKSGLWVYDPDVGLYHRASTSTDEVVDTTSFTVSNNTITTVSTHHLKTGDSVIFATVGGVSGIDASTPYYVDVQSATSFKLAASRQALKEGKTLVISGTPTTDRLFYVPNKQWGDSKATSGAIGRVVPNESVFENWTSDVVWASRAYDEDGNNIYVLNGLTDQYNIGYATTQRVYSGNIQQNWQSVYTFLDSLDFENESLTLKYKLEARSDKPTKETLGTWLDSSTINAAIEDYPQIDTIEVGDELTFVRQWAQGEIVHVTAVERTSNTVSLTVDTAVGSAGKQSFFFADNFIKMSVKDKDHAERVLRHSFGHQSKSDWVQVKAVMRGFQTKIAMFDIVNEVNQSAV